MVICVLEEAHSSLLHYENNKWKTTGYKKTQLRYYNMYEYSMEPKIICFSNIAKLPYHFCPAQSWYVATEYWNRQIPKCKYSWPGMYFVWWLRNGGWDFLGVNLILNAAQCCHQLLWWLSLLDQFDKCACLIANEQKCVILFNVQAFFIEEVCWVPHICPR